jgi:hypothetical protein
LQRVHRRLQQVRCQSPRTYWQSQRVWWQLQQELQLQPVSGSVLAVALCERRVQQVRWQFPQVG